MNKLLCIVGPTATGKTDIALALAKKNNGELVACDSRQVYTGLDLGTGKEAGSDLVVSKNDGYWVIDGIKIWMYDVVDPGDRYSVSNYMADAQKAVQNILTEGKLPIVVGGTGLYLGALLDGVETSLIVPNEKLRRELEVLTLEQIQHKYAELSPEHFSALNNSERNNPRRLIRKIEILKQGKKLDVNGKAKIGLSGGMNILKIGLTAQKEFLNERIEKRVIKRLDQGMLDEARTLYKEGLSYERMRELGLEYGVMADFLEEKFETEEQFVITLQQKIKQFAKRQITWFKRDKEIHWFDITDQNFQSELVKMVRSWYNTKEGLTGTTSTTSTTRC